MFTQNTLKRKINKEIGCLLAGWLGFGWHYRWILFMLDWLIDWFTVLLFYWLIDWLINWLYNWLIDWLIDLGQYFAPGKAPPEGERKLFLAIESTSELAVQKAKVEITRLLKVKQIEG